MATTRESADGDGLRTVDPVESTRRRYSIPPDSGEEDKGVDRFEDGFKGEDIFIDADDPEDEPWGSGGSGNDFSLGEVLGDGVGLFEDEDMIGD